MPTCTCARNSSGGTPRTAVTAGTRRQGEEQGRGDALFTVRTSQPFRFLPRLQVT